MAALVRGAKFNRFHKFLSDVTKAGGVLVALSDGPMDFFNRETAQQTEPEFSHVSDWEGAPGLCLVFYQAALSKAGPDLPPTKQRLVGFDDMQDEDFKLWVMKKRAAQQAAA